MVGIWAGSDRGQARPKGARVGGQGMTGWVTEWA